MSVNMPLAAQTDKGMSHLLVVKTPSQDGVFVYPVRSGAASNGVCFELAEGLLTLLNYVRFDTL